MKKVIIIAGPTASGKTDVAIMLAKQLNGEIINADSRQIYKGLDIGTNKGNLIATQEQININGKVLTGYDLENSGVLGWLFSFLDLNHQYSVADFKQDAEALIKLIAAMGKTPIIVGGTGLYIDSLVKNYQLGPVLPDTQLRQELDSLSVAELFDRLNIINPEKAVALNESDRANPHRLIRAIEKVMQHPAAETKSSPSEFEYQILYPLFDKEALLNRINQRAAKMLDQGMIEETKQALGQGFKDTAALSGLGYKEVVEFLEQRISREELELKLAQVHRNYAKRQITWFEGAARNYNLIKIDYKADFNHFLTKLEL